MDPEVLPLVGGYEDGFRVQQIVPKEYLDAVKQAEERVRGLNKELERALSNWSLKPVVESLMALRGVQLVTAMSLVTELGDMRPPRI